MTHSAANRSSDAYDSKCARGVAPPEPLARVQGEAVIGVGDDHVNSGGASAAKRGGYQPITDAAPPTKPPPKPADAKRCVTAADGRVLTEYEKGYLDGLLEGTRHTGIRKWTVTYKLAAEKYLASIGCEGWSVNVHRA